MILYSAVILNIILMSKTEGILVFFIAGSGK